MKLRRTENSEKSEQHHHDNIIVTWSWDALKQNNNNNNNNINGNNKTMFISLGIECAHHQLHFSLNGLIFQWDTKP